MSPFTLFRRATTPAVRISDPNDDSPWFESKDVEALWDARGDYRFLRIVATWRDPRRSSQASFLTVSLRIAPGSASASVGPVDGRLQYKSPMLVCDGPVRARELVIDNDTVDGVLEARAYEPESENDQPTMLDIHLQRITPDTDGKFVDNLEKIVRHSPAQFPDILHWFDIPDRHGRNRRSW